MLTGNPCIYASVRGTKCHRPGPAPHLFSRRTPGGLGGGYSAGNRLSHGNQKGSKAGSFRSRAGGWGAGCPGLLAAAATAATLSATFATPTAAAAALQQHKAKHGGKVNTKSL